MQLELFKIEIEYKKPVKYWRVEEWIGYYSLYQMELVTDLHQAIPNTEKYYMRTEPIITSKQPLKYTENIKQIWEAIQW